jgi:hypothetical protein
MGKSFYDSEMRGRAIAREQLADHNAKQQPMSGFGAVGLTTATGEIRARTYWPTG